jgi:hypothetical protein
MWDKVDERISRFCIDLVYRGDLEAEYVHFYKEGIEKNDIGLILKGYEEHKKIKSINGPRSTRRINYLK